VSARYLVEGAGEDREIEADTAETAAAEIACWQYGEDGAHEVTVEWRDSGQAHAVAAYSVTVDGTPRRNIVVSEFRVVEVPDNAENAERSSTMVKAHWSERLQLAWRALRNELKAGAAFEDALGEAEHLYRLTPDEQERLRERYKATV
jgi:hypothetical protein